MTPPANNTDPPLKILIDDREKTPYSFRRFIPRYVESESVVRLRTGDYTVIGLEDVICVERKSAPDICSCIYSKRFREELERMRDFAESHVIIDCEYHYLLDYPRWMPAGVRNRIKVNGYAVARQIYEFQNEFPTRWHYAGYDGASMTLGLLKCASRHHKQV